MKKLKSLLIILIITIVTFQMIDKEVYMKTKPLIKSIKVYNKKNTDTYYFIFEFDKYMKTLEGSYIYFHGRPLKSDVELLPKNRQKYKFDNWDFKLNGIDEENNTYVKTIDSKAKNFSALSFGIYKTPNGKALERKEIRGVVLKNINLSKAGEISELNADNLEKTGLTFNKKDLEKFGYYDKKEVVLSKAFVVFLALLAMTVCIVNYVEKVVVGEYKSKKDIPGVLTLVIVGVYPIFIFLKPGALSTIRDILLSLLVTGVLLKKRIERKNLKIYLLILLMIVWWWYSTETGLNPETGMKWYRGIIEKYLWLPICLALVKIDKNKLEKLWNIYILASIPYFMEFSNYIGLVRLGDPYSSLKMSAVGASMGGVLLLDIMYKKSNAGIKMLKISLFTYISYLIILSEVRGVWIIFFPILFIMVFFKSFKKNPAITLILIMGVLGYIKTNPDNRYVRRLYSISEIEENQSNRVRIKMWKMTPEIIKNNPIKGIGISGFKTYLTENEDLKKREKELNEILKKEDNNKKEYLKELGDIRMLLIGFSHTHNMYLDMLVSTGVVGALLYMLSIILVIKEFFKGVLAAEDNFVRLSFISIILASIVSLSYGITDYPLKIEQLQQSLWFFMGLMLNYQFTKKDN